MRYQSATCFLSVICILLIAASTPAAAEPAPRLARLVIAVPSAPANAQSAALKAGQRGGIPTYQVIFDNTAPGDTNMEGIGVVNHGPGDLEIIEVEDITGPDAGVFTITEDDCTDATVPAEEFCEIWIEFSPPDYGTYQAGFQIHTDHVGVPTHAIILLGVSIKDQIFKDRFEVTQ